MPSLRIAAAATLLALATPVLAAGPVAEITGIRAQLYYENKGTFSDDILTQKDFTLWNTIIGEGSAAGSSTATFVSVEVKGKDVPMGQVKIEVVATGDKGKVLAKSVTDVMIYDARTAFYAPLWLSNTGCEEIKVSAKLTGKDIKGTPFTKTIPFKCGE